MGIRIHAPGAPGASAPPTPHSKGTTQDAAHSARAHLTHPTHEPNELSARDLLDAEHRRDQTQQSAHPSLQHPSLHPSASVVGFESANISVSVGAGVSGAPHDPRQALGTALTQLGTIGAVMAGSAGVHGASTMSGSLNGLAVAEANGLSVHSVHSAQSAQNASGGVSPATIGPSPLLAGQLSTVSGGSPSARQNNAQMEALLNELQAQRVLILQLQSDNSSLKVSHFKFTFLYSVLVY